MKELLRKRWVRAGVAVLGCIALVYALIYADVVLRARSAYLEGEKYWAWHEHPQEKTKAFAAELEKEKDKLGRERSRGKITEDEYTKRLEMLSFDSDQRLRESSIKYAYIWYQTVVELFSPPESKWVRLSREKMPRARELWKTELRANNIPFEDYMLE